MILAAYTVVDVTLATTGLVLLRRSVADASVAELVREPGFYLGFVCYALSFGTFVFALRRFEVLTVYPLFTGLAYATVAIAAVLFLGEQMTPLHAAAIALIGGGVVLLVR